MLEYSHQILAYHRLITIHVTGGEQRHLAFGNTCRFSRVGAGVSTNAFAQRVAVILRQLRFCMHAEHGLQQLAGRFHLIDGVDHLGHHRNTSQITDGIGTGKNSVAGLNITLLVFVGLGTQHQVWKVEIPLVRRHIRTLGHITEVAQVTVIDHLPVVLFFNPIDFKCRRLVHQVEQGREGLTQTDAATTSMADIEHPLHLFEQRLFVIKIGAFPVQRMPGWRFQITFSRCCWRRHGDLPPDKDGQSQLLDQPAPPELHYAISSRAFW